MALFGLFGKKKKYDDTIYDEDNLYEKIKNDHERQSESEDMYQPLDEALINQAMAEERSMKKDDEKKTYVEQLCEQMAICSKRVDSAKKEYQAVNSYINDITAIETMSEPDKTNVEYYARRIITLREDKKSMKLNSAKIPDSKYIYMQHHEEEISEILKGMSEDEKECQSLKTDMHHIEGEKIALMYEKRDAIGKLNAMRRLAKMGILTVVTTILMLVGAQIFTNENFTLAIYIVIIVALIMAAAVIVANQKYTYELKMSEKKLNKAIGLMNKYKLLYVNVQSRLDYQYEVNGVKSSYELNELWRLYLVAKKEKEAFHLNADNMFKSVEGLIAELDKHHLYDTSVWPSQVDAIVDPKEMTEIRHTLNVRRQKLREVINFNTQTIEKTKQRIQGVIEKNPYMAKEILAMLDRYDG